ncbi:metallophosphoesterase [Qipengyuania vesicularis]|uniref:metallophosphoesterase n=1 Tax=Qipengyuania vesicularis TaxID=2867232 RepID=UPI001C867D8E|nr:metallophosphoesterase [Qipengyuania vesicularis]MBX7528482.1 metallophosphoesterase [Qipengyuania vesicularis]
MHRLLLWLTALAAWAAFPALAQVSEEPATRIVAVGDLHGDFDAWEAIARQAGLIDKHGDWSGGDTTLVQLGDVTDRGPDSLRIIQHLQALQVEAAKDGGAVIVLLGNHEAMNVIGDLRYVHPGEYAAFSDKRSKSRREAVWKANREALETYYSGLDPPLSPEDAKEQWFAETPLGMLEHRRAWRPGGELGLWAASLPAVVMVGNTLFAHGGLSEERTRQGIDALNASVTASLQPGDEVDRSALEDPLGPLWYRGNVARSEKDAAGNVPEGAEPAPRPSREEEIAAILARYDAKRLVVAHTPSREGIASDLAGRLIRVDTGISAHYGGPASFLVIEGDVLAAHERGSDGTWTTRAIGQAAHEETP